MSINLYIPFIYADINVRIQMLPITSFIHHMHLHCIINANYLRIVYTMNVCDSDRLLVSTMYECIHVATYVDQ